MTDELSQDAQNSLFEYYAEKSKRKGDYFFREANMISGSADYQPSDEGMHWSDMPTNEQL